MDQLVIDITNIPQAAVGDTVLAFGVSPDGTLPAEEVAHQFGTIGYELTTRIGKRLPRFYR
jgi:alanine racemase